ncbi:hypothetical protein CRG98_048518 [Punica granatum]|uniref:Uncharacterized protein n=1 Tax=Punica granatum TaxID=22663 RepID=A0A2I0HHC5_PUNGR|nr:hypothetical protein CRG98_048518 [Punica granatum]
MAEKYISRFTTRLAGMPTNWLELFLKQRTCCRRWGFAGGCSEDLGGGGEAAHEEAADHEGVGLGVEGVELGGDVGLRAGVGGTVWVLGVRVVGG